MNIEEVKGIIIDIEGNTHAFGKHKYGNSSTFSEENYHEPSFNNEIVPTKWFQEFIKNLNFDYNEYKQDRSIHQQFILLAENGLAIILNGCSSTQNGEYHLYTIQTPTNLSEKQKETLAQNYQKLNNIIEEDNAFFEGIAYDNNGNEWSDSAYDLDTFYDNMNIEKYKGKTF